VLYRQSEGLRKAGDTRALIAELTERASAEHGKYEDEAVSRWTEWASAVASGFDQFENGYFEGLAPHGSKPVVQD
jgi:hypothetical protein